jgi:dTDP-4-dehydrorhamnose 3,5-epimerase
MEIPEIKTISGGLATDDRGTVRFVNDFDFNGVKRFYQVQNHRAGFIRAWHGHRKESKYVYVASGTVLIGAVPLDQIEKGREAKNIFKAIVSANNPKIIYIPAGYANGFKTLEENTIIQFFSSTSLQESLNDDVRFDFNLINIWDEDFR